MSAAAPSPDPLLAADLHIQATYRLTEALVESEKRMRRRVDLLSEIVFETDAHGLLVFLNRAWTEALGHPLESSLGRALSQFVAEEDRPLYELAMQGAGPTGPAGRAGLRFVRAAGGMAWMEISIAQLAGGGAVGALHDVTAMKQAAGELTKLSMVASRTDNLVIITDGEGRTEWVNEAFTRRTGYALEEMLGRRPDELLQGADSDRNTLAQIRAALAEGRAFKAEMLNYTRAGDPYWVSFQTTPIRDAAGRVERFVSIQSDDTERRRTQRELTAAKEQAEGLAVRAQAASQAKSEFLATMSHEIRTPLHGVLGMAELLQRSNLDAHQRQLADYIANSGEALLGIINDILDLSKIEAGHMALVEEEFELRPLVGDVVALLAQSGHGKPVSIESVCAPTVPARFRGDPGRLRQVLLNLMGNGLKFTTAGSVVTHIRPLSSAVDRMGLRFEVVDTGMGIAPAKHALLFQLFQQLDSSDSRRHGGTGLGLAISRRLIEMMGGRIGVESAEGQGSTFWFELELPVVAGSSPPVPAAALPGMRVLVAQNGELMRRLLLISLDKLGCRADPVGSASDALQQWQQTAYDAVIFDLELADMDGVKLAVALRELEQARGVQRPVRLIAIVVHETSEMRGQLLTHGIDDTLESPFGQARLKQALLGATT